MSGRKFRTMTAYESAVMGRLLELPFEGRDELRGQLSNALVREIAAAGDHNGSIEFRVEERIPAPARWSVPVEGKGQDSDGSEIDFLLHLKDGFLDSLEVVKADGSAIERLPEASALQVSLLTYGRA